MATFIMFGKYSQESIKGISAARTGKAKEIIKNNGGQLHSAYALLGEKDLILILEFPDVEASIKASLELHKATGISFSTYPALAVEQFDKMVSEM